MGGDSIQSRGRLLRAPFSPKLNQEMKVKTMLAQNSVGRVILHLACMIRDGQLRWHWKGIVREVEG